MRQLAEWLSYIERAHPRAWDLGLDRVRQVALRLDVLPPAPRNIVVAGTNGKGSTCIYAEALLRSTGLSVGTTLSPHLFRFNERIRVDGAPVADAVIVDAFERIESVRGEVTLTYFEYGILAALTVFRAARVDVTVLEVGLGGRLDAVNLVDADVSVITNIGLDHQDYLGPDLESIGAEKAGILRQGARCVFGDPRVPDSVVARSEELGAPLLVRQRDFGIHLRSPTAAAKDWHFWGTSAAGCIDAERLERPSVALANAASALQAVLTLGVKDDPRALCAAAANARLPGRFECRRLEGRDCILDVAHNPHGAAFFAEQIGDAEHGGRTVAVMGCLKDKDAAGIVAALQDQVDEWIFVDTGTSRGQSADATMRKVDGGVRAMLAPDVIVGLERAVRVTRPCDRILVCGGFDIVQRALQHLDAEA